VVSFTPRERAPDTLWMGVWMDPRAVLDAYKRYLINQLDSYLANYLNK